MDDHVRFALGMIHCGVLVVDEGRIEFANKEFGRLLSVPDVAALIGRTYEDVVVATAPAAQDPDEFAARLRELATSTMPVNEDVATLDGRVLEREYLPVVVDGHRRGHVSLYWDVSIDRAAQVDRARRQRAEIIAQQLGVQAQRTRAAEAERTGRTLAERNRELAEADLHRQEMLATASHELRTPLTSILNFSELLCDSSTLSGDERDFIEVINRNAQHLLHTVEDVLLLASLGSSPRQLELRPVDIAPIIAESVRRQQTSADERAVRLLVALPEDMVVPGDRAALGRVFANLLGNAIKYSDAGGTVRVRGESTGDAIVVEIADEGIGIPPNEVERVFAQFYRATTARQSDRPGTGLGLAIVSSIVNQHGGTVRMRSTVGAGTTVTLRLPAR